MAGLDMSIKNFSFRGFSHATVGLLVGTACAWVLTRVGIFETGIFAEIDEAASVFQLTLFLGLGFLGMMLALRSNKEEFAFIIPYVRFRQDSVRDQPILADTNVIIDGRIPRICAAGFLSGSVIVPRFVIDELHTLADSNNEIRSERGKRGLECLDKIRNSDSLDVEIYEDFHIEAATVDAKLVQLARRLGARLLTNDVNLGQVARVQGLTVLSLNDLTRAMQTILKPGDDLLLQLVKKGKDPTQAVGYLPDGAMIVVNGAADKVGTEQAVVVIGITQTSAGRLIFADLKSAQLAESA